MDGINLTNDNSAEPVILSTEQLEHIADFKKNIEKAGVVCRKDVLSLEDFLGVPIITKKINPKKLTGFPSRTMHEEVCDELEEHSDKYEPVTNFMVLEKAKKLAYDLREFKYLLTNLASANNQDFLDKAVSNEYAYAMDEDKLINLTDLSLIKLLTYHYSYLESITNDDKASYITNELHEDSVFTGLMLLLNKDKLSDFYYIPHLDSIDDITLRSVIDTVKHGSAIPSIENMLDRVNVDIKDLTNNKSWDNYDKQDLGRNYKRYTSIDNVLFDKSSKILLRFLYNPKEL